MPHRPGERASVGELGRPAHRACGLGGAVRASPGLRRWMRKRGGEGERV